MLEAINKNLINEVVEQAKQSPRLRMNYNLHKSLDDKCQRFINALEPGTVMPIHHHTVDEVYIILQGKLRVIAYDENAKLTESIILEYGNDTTIVQIPANTWHSVESLQEGTVIFELKEGPYIPHEISGILKQYK